MNPSEFRRQGHILIDWLADYYQNIETLPVQPQTKPGDVKAHLPKSAPSEPEDFRKIIDDLDRVVLPHVTHWQHPDFFGYFPSNSLGAGVLGDLVSTGLGVLGLSWQSSPAVTEVEEVVVDWFRQMVGLSPGWFGVINDTASTSTLVSLLCGRERATDFSMTSDGLQGDHQTLVVYTSASAHSSVEKGALLAGFGRSNVRHIEVDENFAMRADLLEQAIIDDRAKGRQPCAIVAAIGGTATASIDPLSQIAAIARRHHLWLHVDAAMAGNAMILPECRWMWDGIEEADSLVINPHKWLGVPFDCSLYFIRDEQHLQRVMSTSASYLQSRVDSQVRNLRDTGIPLGRRFRALKLWFLIREQGVSGLQERLRRDLALARDLADQVAGTPDWQLIAPVHLQTVCIRYQPAIVPEEKLNAFTRAWAEAINSSGKAYVTPAAVNGQWMVRVSIGAPNTGTANVQRLWSLIREVTASTAPEFTR